MTAASTSGSQLIRSSPRVVVAWGLSNRCCFPKTRLHNDLQRVKKLGAVEKYKAALLLSSEAVFDTSSARTAVEAMQDLIRDLSHQ